MLRGLFCSGLLSYLVGMKRRPVGVLHARETTFTVMYLSLKAEILYLPVTIVASVAEPLLHTYQ